MHDFCSDLNQITWDFGWWENTQNICPSASLALMLIWGITFYGYNLCSFLMYNLNIWFMVEFLISRYKTFHESHTCYWAVNKTSCIGKGNITNCPTTTYIIVLTFYQPGSLFAAIFSLIPLISSSFCQMLSVRWHRKLQKTGHFSKPGREKAAQAHTKTHTFSEMFLAVYIT